MDSISRRNGGIFEAERRLQRGLNIEAGADVRVIGLRDDDTESDLDSWLPLEPVACTVRGPHSFGYSPDLESVLVEAGADVASFVGLWKYPSVAALRWKRRTGRPYMVSPHGMLDPWAVRNSGWKKRIAALLFQNTQLREAACIRALCQAEADSIRAYGLANPICVIPNGVDCPTPEEILAIEHASPFPFGRKILLSLGRLHPKKGLGNLLQAWGLILAQGNQDWVLVIAGWDQGGYESALKQQAKDLGIVWADGQSPVTASTSLIFLGPQFGDAKRAAYFHSDAFILPSLSEGLPMVVLEAWAHGKPVLMTPACNLPEGYAAEAALRLDPTPSGIAEGIRHLIEMSALSRRAMGERGLRLVRQHFSWPKIVQDMHSVYKWILGTASAPECLRND
jgi:poly(glycerol-phosphate) alpha-glucosyltransferase